MYASIVDGKVSDVLSEPRVGDLFVECGPEVRPGWVLKGGVCVAPPEPPAPDPNAAIDRQIGELEQRQHRAVREFIAAKTQADSDAAKARVADIEIMIAGLRAQRS